MADEPVRTPLEQIPVVSPNRRWIKCGATIVAVRAISFIEVTHVGSIRVTLRDGTIRYTRPLGLEEQAAVFHLLYGMTTTPWR